MRTLVTGGAGFIGSALVERLLAEGHTVDVVDNLSSGSLWNLADARASAGRDLTFHQLDVRSPDVAELVTRRRPDVVWHLAAQTDIAGGISNPSGDAHVNIVGTLALLEGVRAAGARKLIVTSSAAVYGDVRGDAPIAESTGRRPISPHGIAKHAVDAYLAAYAELEAIVFTSLVLGTVYGPRSMSGVVADWAQCLVTGRPCTVVGDGKQVRDFVYVDDVVDALARSADRGDGMVLNVGTGTGTSLADLHIVMVEAAGRLVAEASEAGGGAGEERAGTVARSAAGKAVEGGPRPDDRVPDAAAPDIGAAPDASAAPDVAAPDASAVAASAATEPDGGAGDGVQAEEGAAVVRRGPALGLRQASARPGEPRHVVLDPSRAAKVLEWAPWTDLPTGVEAVLRGALSRRS